MIKLEQIIRCDHPECDEVSNITLSSSLTTTAEESERGYEFIRAASKAHGWTHKDGRDYCPKHKEG